MATASYSEVVRPSPVFRETERMTTAATRTVQLYPRTEHAEKMSVLLAAIEDLKISSLIEGVRSIGSAFHEITTRTTLARNEVERSFKENKESLYKIVENEEEPYSLTIDGLHAEYPTLAITEYLHKYFEDPRVERLYHDGTHFLNGKATVTHKGAKMEIKRFIYVGPNMSVKVLGHNHIPLEDFKVRCTRCLQDNHLVYSCKNQMRCSKCKEQGHQRRECPTDRPTEKQIESPPKKPTEKQKTPTKENKKKEEESRKPEENPTKKRTAHTPTASPVRDSRAIENQKEIDEGYEQWTREMQKIIAEEEEDDRPEEITDRSRKILYEETDLFEPLSKRQKKKSRKTITTTQHENTTYSHHTQEQLSNKPMDA